MNPIEMFATDMQKYCMPYGFVWVRPVRWGLMENFDGFFRVTDGTHLVQGFFLVNDLDREKKCYSISIFSSKNINNCLLQFNVGYSDLGPGFMSYEQIYQRSMLYSESCALILHVIVFGAIISRSYTVLDSNTWYMAIDMNQRKKIERLVESDIETVVSSLQMFIN